jgi:hypothetical protein
MTGEELNHILVSITKLAATIQHSVSKRLLTRVGVNRRRATAEEQILYSIEVLNESQHNKKNLYAIMGQF